MNDDMRALQDHHHWLRERNRRSCAVVTDPVSFGISASMRRTAEKYGLPTSRLLLACRAMRAELDRTNEPLPAYREGMRVLVSSH